ncbi:hypothetical protein C791_6801 [Amycolatopsis azurea DSM 43854]|uniref:Uncharacterized protein n=1 Tax=Amycolatopsis azurea DSM 43854 TaxID=1238180 RepID=M2PVU2_9PSEU|nr:hypothetical protein C791_6801 [Amycolatopsis azurea DSM 43854]
MEQTYERLVESFEWLFRGFRDRVHDCQWLFEIELLHDQVAPRA